TKTGHGVSRNLLLRPLPTRPAKNPIAKKAKPAEKIDGFVSSLKAGETRPFCFVPVRLVSPAPAAFARRACKCFWRPLHLRSLVIRRPVAYPLSTP
ncbi:hypothetical protein, partial [Rhizobium pisi]|uniref:hypothetical protein n=3 Tax=Rhizobium pisi TaxID=574561 RepID=UPI001ABF9CE9